MESGLAARHAMRAQPGGELRLVDLAGGDGEHGLGGFQLADLQAETIEPQKQADSKKGDALVAVGERVVFCQSDTISGGEIGMVGLTISDQIQRAGQCGIQQAFIAQTGQATVLGQTLSMQQQQGALINPMRDAVHFANA